MRSDWFARGANLMDGLKLPFGWPSVLCLCLPLATIGAGGSCLAAKTGLTVTFVARGPQTIVKDLSEAAKTQKFGQHEFSAAGHAFLIVGTQTKSGIKEEVYGFYPKGDSPRAIIKGPGELRSDLRCGPSDDCSKDNYIHLKRMSEVDTSVQIPISTDQYRIIMADVAKWNGDAFSGPDNLKVSASDPKGYSLFGQNCVEFIAGVAKDIGYPLAVTNGPIAPVDYLRLLAPYIKQQDALRQIAQRKLDEQKANEAFAAEQRKKAEAKKKDDEAAAQAKADAEEAERNRIPSGWVGCSCPDQHRSSGKIVRGVLYHPPGLVCR